MFKRIPPNRDIIYKLILPNWDITFNKDLHHSMHIVCKLVLSNGDVILNKDLHLSTLCKGIPPNRDLHL